MDRVVALSFKSFGPGFSCFSDVRFEGSGFIRICGFRVQTISRTSGGLG